jgi:hypothetical protein
MYFGKYSLLNGIIWGKFLKCQLEKGGKFERKRKKVGRLIEKTAKGYKRAKKANIKAKHVQVYILTYRGGGGGNTFPGG